MIKLYRNMEQPHSWTAYVPEAGWVVFPATENGWEKRRPAHGLDPLHLREAPLSLAANTGLTKTAHTRTYSKVA
ncbi:MAG: hypothetical protein LAP40_23790 [Acidobacteriia bacterium]|nr:hypothetical protein [Terriglobia bacterium]